MNYEEIIAITSILSAIGGLFAAWAAARSAKIAQDATQQAKEAEKRQLTRTAKASAQGIITEYKRAINQAEQLKVAYGDLFQFAGSNGREKICLDEIEEKCSALRLLEQKASDFLASSKVRSYSEEETTDLLAEFSAALSELMVAKEQFRDRRVSVEQENSMFKERRLSK
jgi:hypothetical protein